MMMWIGLGLALSLCLLPTASALDDCSYDEIYNQTTDTCSCNLAMYNSTAMPPTPDLQCLSGQIKITVSKCQLERSGYDSSNLYLLDSSCVGVRKNASNAEIVLELETSSSCGTIMTTSDFYLIYTNNVTVPGKIYSNQVRARNDVVFTFSCSYPLQLTAALQIGIHSENFTGHQYLNGYGSMNVEIHAYTDSIFDVAYTDHMPVLHIGDPMYIGVKLPDLDATSLSAQVTRLYATLENSTYSAPAYDIISGGCPSVDFTDIMSVKKNGNETEAQFVLQVFEITGTETFFLFAEVTICTGTCVPNCS
ncbi:uromodulin-like [Lissotriton helveticus]